MCSELHTKTVQSLVGYGCRQVLELPVRNSTRVDLIEHNAAVNGFKVTTASIGGTGTDQQVLYARKVVLATGIQVSPKAVRSAIRWCAGSRCNFGL